MEEIVQFGPGDRLVGLLSGDPATSGVATLVLPNAGMIPRAGPFRMHVQLARRLAAEGRPVFRFDLPGVGEAPRLSDCTAAEAVAAAFDRLAERHGCRQFVLGGVCSAADLAWRVASADSRVSGLLLLDGVCFRGPWFLLARLRHAFGLSPAEWIRRLRQRIVGRRGGGGAVVAARHFRDWPQRARVRREVSEMLARGMRLLLVFTGGASDRFQHRRQLAWSFGGAAAKAVEFHHWPDCDHLYYRRGDRERLLDTISQWLRRP